MVIDVLKTSSYFASKFSGRESPGDEDVEDQIIKSSSYWLFDSEWSEVQLYLNIGGFPGKLSLNSWSLAQVLRLLSMFQLLHGHFGC